MATRTSVVNDGTEIEAARVRVAAYRASEMRVTVDGARVDSAGTGGETRWTLAVPPGSTRTVTVSAEASLDARPSPWKASPTKARHRWLGTESHTETPTLRVCPATDTRWARAERAELHVRGPSRWQLQVAGKEHQDGVGHGTIDGCRELGWKPDPPTFPVYHGGPLLGVGGALGDGWRGRLGYELGWSTWLVASMNVESDFGDQIFVAPVVEAATAAVFILPSVGAGLGAPVRVRPDTTVGLRGQLSVTWGVGAVLFADYYPSDQTWQAVLMGQVGL